MTLRVRVAVVGAGFAGIAMGRRLAAAGESFVILERRDGVGGTWYDNTYPGVACDVPAHLYCFADVPNPGFSRVFAPGKEIREYLETAAAPVADRLRLRTALEDASWDGRRWTLRTSTTGEASDDGDARTVIADVLILACGRLTEPSRPAVPGEFAGPIVHSARWDHDIDLSGRRVALVGTGATAVQLLPELAATAASVTVLQRSAPYILPKGDRGYEAAERELFEQRPTVLRDLRSTMFDEAEAVFDERAGAGREAARGRALAHLADRVIDPVVREAVRPDHEFGCKRVLFSDDYYEALNLPHVRLIPQALHSYSADAVHTADGGRHEVDAVILATGFRSTRQPYAALIRGRGGRTLEQHWSEGMRAYASTAVHGFPNLFVLDGPNATLPHNSAVLMIEAQADYVTGALPWTRRGPLEVTAEAEEAYAREIAERSGVWTSGCSNWYVDPRSGRQVLLWPGRAAEFRNRFGHFDPGPYQTREPARV